MDSSYDHLIHEFMKNDRFQNALIAQLADFGDRLVQEIKGIPEGGIGEEAWQHDDIFPTSIGLEGKNHLWSDLLESLSESVIWVDRTGTIRGANQQIEVLLRQPRTELTGKSFVDLVHTDDRQQLFELWSSALRHRNQSFQIRLYHKEGTHFPATLRAIPLIETGNFLGTLLVINRLPDDRETHSTPTTSRKDADDGTYLTGIPHEKIRKILHQIKEVFYIASANGTVTYVNPEVEEILGYTSQEILAMNVNEKFEDPRDRAQFRQLLQLHGWVKDFRYTFKNKRGELCYLSETASVLTNNDDQIIGYYGIIRDRTAEHHIEQALKNSEENYRVLIEQLPLALILLDTSGRILQANKQGTQCLNSNSASSIKGNSVFEICQPENAHLIREALQTATAGQTLTNQWQRKDSKGDLRWWQMTFSPVFLNGAVEKVIWIAHDIDQEKRLQDQLRLSQKMETVATLINGLAHDFNNQLGVILGNASLVKDQLKPDEEYYEEINAIESTALSFRASMDQLLTLTRKEHYQQAALSVNKLVRDIADFAARSFPKNITISVELLAGPDQTTGDQDNLYQALLNVCVNSRDAMSEGGQITITTRNITRKSVMPGQDSNHFIQISILDTGEGMDAETCRRVFEPFFTTKRESGNTGLGMSTTYSIIQHHEGYIEVESKQGEGTKVDVFLPLTESRAKVVEINNIEQDEVRDLPSKETLLVVDDEPQVRAMISRIFEKEGFTVHLAENGLRALELLQRHASDIHLVVLDMTMPEMDGKETLEHIRKLYSNVPVLLSSGYSLNQEIQDLTKQPHTYFIHKPYRRAAILQIVQQILSKSLPLSTP
jgi:PAS domain S-box-containing protein